MLFLGKWFASKEAAVEYLKCTKELKLGKIEKLQAEVKEIEDEIEKYEAK